MLGARLRCRRQSGRVMGGTLIKNNLLNPRRHYSNECPQVSTFPAITPLIFELQTSRSEHPNRNAEIHQMAGSRAFSTFPAISRPICELQTSRSERPNRNTEI